MSKSVMNVAQKGLLRQHKAYGELVRLLKYMPSATGGIYRQRKRVYESPYEIKASVARLPEEEILSRIGEASERNAEITIPVAYLREVFGTSTKLRDMITTSDLIVFDNRVWRITQCSFTGRIGDEPLLVYILLREKLGAKEVDYA
tara:strand:+ start:22238 stop:22675 length:438 start_codon:yes stop_codon:yes gene_type:complete